MIQFMERQSIFINKNGKIFCNKKSIFTSRKDDISKVPWKEWGVDIIIDCSGVLENTIRSKNIVNQKIAKKVIFTNSPENVDFTMILGLMKKTIILKSIT